MRALGSIRQVGQIGVRRLRPGCALMRTLGSGSTQPGRRYSTGWKAGDDSGDVDGVLTDLPALCVLVPPKPGPPPPHPRTPFPYASHCCRRSALPAH